MAFRLDMHVLTGPWPRTSAVEHGSWVRQACTDLSVVKDFSG